MVEISLFIKGLFMDDHLIVEHMLGTLALEHFGLKFKIQFLKIGEFQVNLCGLVVQLRMRIFPQFFLCFIFGMSSITPYLAIQLKNILNCLILSLFLKFTVAMTSMK